MQKVHLHLTVTSPCSSILDDVGEEMLWTVWPTVFIYAGWMMDRPKPKRDLRISRKFPVAEDPSTPRINQRTIRQPKTRAGMLQRRVLQRPQCILCLRRYASFYTGFGPNPATSLLTTNSESTTSSTPSKKGEAEDDPEIVVLNRRTGKRASVKMSKVKPFEGDYGILPLAQRLEVERRELLKTLRERQEGDVWKKVQQDLENAKKKDELKKLDVTEDRIDMRVRRMLMKRRAVTSVMPSEAKVRQYIRYARELEKRRLLRLRTRENEQQQKPQQKNQQKGQQKDEDKKEETPNTQTLSFKEQWERRQLYGI